MYIFLYLIFAGVAIVVSLHNLDRSKKTNDKYLKNISIAGIIIWSLPMSIPTVVMIVAIPINIALVLLKPFFG